MKLPNGNPAPPPKTDTPLPSPSRPAGERASATPDAASARIQLDQLKLANREATLARVADVINRQSSAGAQLLLDIRGQSLSVQAAIGETSLETGDWVKVMRAGNELQLMGKLAQAPEAGIARALAQRLPWQQSLDAGLARVLSTLTAGARPESGPTGAPPGAPSQPLPAPVRQAIEQLAARLPSSQSLTPGAGTQPGMASQLKQWVEESGLFAESRLARAPDAALPDLKLAIGRIITSLLAQQGSRPEAFNRFTPLPSQELVQAPLQFPNTLPPPTTQAAAEPTVGQMLRLLAGMLNRITVNQLHSQILSARTTAEAPTPVSTMLLELPWLNPANEPRIAQLRIEQDQADSDRQRSGKPTATEWRLSLAMDLDEAGPLHFDVALRQNQLSAQVWAEKQSTLRQVREDLPQLRKGLSDIGLEVVDLECRRGTPRGASTRLEHRLVDTRV
ncbi:flagellar hook-length control protein FliK [Marinobacter vulgaris]|uniref:Flagellar hook-length control protein FliK n=1 Tax=Marinobacter vulgaris TaxID=1928331 RepID=A0A2V3ZKL6_9GAMM|nr:flagellar hook-length control protein FliK [Marinobacter vulgaris]PXX91116.1 flagellar hook-length control protein FliK [Marinobacter vulgaris]TSJ70326.1 flagellar hook-length control protein FliK [Marinobacter vulgaris]